MFKLVCLLRDRMKGDSPLALVVKPVLNSRNKLYQYVMFMFMFNSVCFCLFSCFVHFCLFYCFLFGQCVFVLMSHLTPFFIGSTGPLLVLLFHLCLIVSLVVLLLLFYLFLCLLFSLLFLFVCLFVCLFT